MLHMKTISNFQNKWVRHPSNYAFQLSVQLSPWLSHSRALVHINVMIHYIYVPESLWLQLYFFSNATKLYTRSTMWPTQQARYMDTVAILYSGFQTSPISTTQSQTHWVCFQVSVTHDVLQALLWLLYSWAVCQLKASLWCQSYGNLYDSTTNYKTDQIDMSPVVLSPYLHNVRMREAPGWTTMTYKLSWRVWHAKSFNFICCLAAQHRVMWTLRCHGWMLTLQFAQMEPK